MVTGLSHRKLKITTYVFSQSLKNSKQNASSLSSRLKFWVNVFKIMSRFNVRLKYVQNEFNFNEKQVTKGIIMDVFTKNIRKRD